MQLHQIQADFVFNFKQTPYSHQDEIFKATRELEKYAIWWEMGCGKSKLIVDTAAWLYMRDNIDALFVLAPNGVHRNWITDELPSHCTPDIKWHGVAYYSSRAATRKHQAQLQHLMEVGRRASTEGRVSTPMAVLVMTYDALRTDRGKATAKQFLTTYRCMFVCDESTRVKTPGAQRTKLVLGAVKYAKYRRVMSGSPITNNPFDVYSQVRVLDADFWKNEDQIGSFLAFKHEFGEWVNISPPGQRSFAKLKEYRRLEKLSKMLAKISDRRLKKDVLDLPPKIYTKRYVEMSAVQRKAYDSLRDTYRAEIQGGHELEETEAMTRLLRLQQLACGYAPQDEGKYIDLPGENPRLEALAEFVEEQHQPGIIWGRFKRDLELICDRLKKAGKRVVRYDGTVSERERARAIDAFKAGEADCFVANPAAIAMGVTLVGAKWSAYYSNSFNLEHRVQSEDRNHRIGQHDPVVVVDFVMEDSVDERIVDALRNKKSIASMVLGDQFEEWL